MLEHAGRLIQIRLIGSAEDPLTPALSPRGEGAGCGPSTRASGQFWRPFSPWGEGQDEGVFVKHSTGSGIIQLRLRSSQPQSPGYLR